MQMIWSYKIMTRIHIQHLLFSSDCSGKKSANKLNCTLNTTTCTARTAYRYELLQSLLQLYQKTQLSLVDYSDTVKKEVFSANII